MISCLQKVKNLENSCLFGAHAPPFHRYAFVSEIDLGILTIHAYPFVSKGFRRFKEVAKRTEQAP